MDPQKKFKILNEFYDVNPTLIQRWYNVALRHQTNVGLTLVQRQFWSVDPQKKNSKILNEFYDVNPTLIQRWYNVAPRHRTNVGLTLVQSQFWSVDPQKKIQKFSMSSTT